MNCVKSLRFFTKKINVKFYTKPVPCFPGFVLIFPLFLMSFLLGSDEILMLRILHQLCKQLLPGFLVPALFGSRLHLLSEVCAFVLGNICERFARRDLC